jgi:hypothetical protein
VNEFTEKYMIDLGGARARDANDRNNVVLSDYGTEHNQAEKGEFGELVGRRIELLSDD